MNLTEFEVALLVFIALGPWVASLVVMASSAAKGNYDNRAVWSFMGVTALFAGNLGFCLWT